MPHYNLPHNHGQNIEKVLNKMPSAEGFKDISFLFQQLGDPTRLRILWLLCHCEECVYIQGGLWSAHWNLYENVSHETGRCSASPDTGNHR